MSDLWSQFVLIGALIVVNAVLSAGEIALISLSESQVARIEAERGRRGRGLARLYEDPNRFLATVQVGITLAGFLASATAAVSLADRVTPRLEFLGAAAAPASVVVITLTLAFFTLVLGELAPKRIAMQRSERIALAVTPVLGALEAMARPAVWLLSQATDVVVRAAGGNPEVARADLSEQELRDLLSSVESVSAEQARLLTEALDLGDLTLRDVMVPRTAIVAIEAGSTAGDALTVLVEAHHTRAPVYRGDLDHVAGIAHVLDLATAPKATGVMQHARPVTALPEFVGVLDGLRRMQSDHLQMAMVIDEHGGIEGMVTVEDLVEELVGEIFDEFDREAAGVQRGPGGMLRMRGDFPMHDLPDIGIDLPAGDYSTVGGLVLATMGRIPEEGESVEVAGWRLTVGAREDQAVTEVRAERLHGQPARRRHRAPTDTSTSPPPAS